MKKCVIFCAGELDAPVEIPENALIIAADGGLRHTEALGLRPDVILGDFDSLGYTPQGAEVFPVEKDDSDSMLAARRGLAEGCLPWCWTSSGICRNDSKVLQEHCPVRLLRMP